MWSQTCSWVHSVEWVRPLALTVLRRKTGSLSEPPNVYACGCVGQPRWRAQTYGFLSVFNSNQKHLQHMVNRPHEQNTSVENDSEVDWVCCCGIAHSFILFLCYSGFKARIKSLFFHFFYHIHAHMYCKQVIFQLDELLSVSWDQIFRILIHFSTLWALHPLFSDQCSFWQHILL